jgi:hypothetical protein
MEGQLWKEFHSSRKRIVRRRRRRRFDSSDQSESVGDVFQVAVWQGMREWRDVRVEEGKFLVVMLLVCIGMRMVCS